jgi:hypothetical protein
MKPACGKILASWMLISITRFMNGEPPRPWWIYTAERKRLYGAVVRQADANSQFGKA